MKRDMKSYCRACTICSHFANSGKRLDNTEESIDVCLINVTGYENNYLGVSDQTMNVLDEVVSIDSNAFTSFGNKCQIVGVNELPMNEKTNEVNVFSAKHDVVVVPSLFNLAKFVLARTVHEFVQLHAKSIGSGANGSQLHKSLNNDLVNVRCNDADLGKKLVYRDEVSVEPVAVSCSVSISEPVSVNLVSHVDNKHCVSSVNVSKVILSHLDEEQQVWFLLCLQC